MVWVGVKLNRSVHSICCGKADYANLSFVLQDTWENGDVLEIPEKGLPPRGDSLY